MQYIMCRPIYINDLMFIYNIHILNRICGYFFSVYVFYKEFSTNPFKHDNWRPIFSYISGSKCLLIYHISS